MCVLKGVNNVCVVCVCVCVQCCGCDFEFRLYLNPNYFPFSLSNNDQNCQFFFLEWAKIIKLQGNSLSCKHVCMCVYIYFSVYPFLLMYNLFKSAVQQIILIQQTALIQMQIVYIFLLL